MPKNAEKKKWIASADAVSIWGKKSIKTFLPLPHDYIFQETQKGGKTIRLERKNKSLHGMDRVDGLPGRKIEFRVSPGALFAIMIY